MTGHRIYALTNWSENQRRFGHRQVMRDEEAAEQIAEWYEDGKLVKRYAPRAAHGVRLVQTMGRRTR